MKSKNTNKIIATAIAVVGVYLIYKYYSKKSPKKVVQPVVPSSDIFPPTPTINKTDSFPLKKGSRGANVTSLQKLILKIDSNLLPKFGADGSFGAETESAVVKLLGKKTVDNKADLDKLNQIYMKKTFPYVTPNDNSGNQLPMFKSSF